MNYLYYIMSKLNNIKSLHSINLNKIDLESNKQNNNINSDLTIESDNKCCKKFIFKHKIIISTVSTISILGIIANLIYVYYYINLINESSSIK